jgi:hypothetical protein
MYMLPIVLTDDCNKEIATEYGVGESDKKATATARVCKIPKTFFISVVYAARKADISRNSQLKPYWVL